MKTALIAAILTMTACAGAPRKPAAPAPLTARCNEQAQWTTKNEAGQDIGIFVCFGEESRLLYQVRILPPAPAAPAKAVAVKSYTRKAAVKKPAGNDVELPTVTGKAK